MATHSLMDIATVVQVPKTEYEDLVKASEALEGVKRVLTSKLIDTPNATVGVLRIMLGIEGEEKDETENSSKCGRSHNVRVHSECGERKCTRV